MSGGICLGGCEGSHVTSTECSDLISCDFFLFFFIFSQFFYMSSSALHRRSSTEILPDYWGTLCAGVCPKSVFSFLVAAGLTFNNVIEGLLQQSSCLIAKSKVVSNSDGNNTALLPQVRSLIYVTICSDIVGLKHNISGRALLDEVKFLVEYYESYK